MILSAAIYFLTTNPCVLHSAPAKALCKEIVVRIQGKGSIEAWDRNPFMTATLAPNMHHVKEGDTVTTTVTATDQDTFKKVENSESSFVLVPGTPILSVSLTSADPSTSALNSLTSVDANIGQKIFTTVHVAKSIAEGESTHFYIDVYNVTDAATGALVHDDPLQLTQIVQVDKKP